MKGLVASPLGLLIGFALGALGGGGSILAVPALVYAVPFTVAAMIGVAGGVRAADQLPARMLLRAFSVLLVAVGIYTATSAALAR